MLLAWHPIVLHNVRVNIETLIILCLHRVHIYVTAGFALKIRPVTLHNRKVQHCMMRNSISLAFGSTLLPYLDYEAHLNWPVQERKNVVRGEHAMAGTAKQGWVEGHRFLRVSCPAVCRFAFCLCGSLPVHLRTSTLPDCHVFWCEYKCQHAKMSDSSVCGCDRILC